VNRPHPKSPSGWTGRAGRVEPMAPKTSAPGVLVYRCRLCSEQHVVPTADAANAAEFEHAQRRLTRVHPCGPGRVGVADLVGGVAGGPEEGK
jgi:hypothetical protein